VVYLLNGLFMMMVFFMITTLLSCSYCSFIVFSSPFGSLGMALQATRPFFPYPFLLKIFLRSNSLLVSRFLVLSAS
jgi:hypothetical protein